MTLMLCCHNKGESGRLGYWVAKGGVTLILITKFKLITELSFTSDLNVQLNFFSSLSIDYPPTFHYTISRPQQHCKRKNIFDFFKEKEKEERKFKKSNGIRSIIAILYSFSWKIYLILYFVNVIYFINILGLYFGLLFCEYTQLTF